MPQSRRRHVRPIPHPEPEPDPHRAGWLLLAPPTTAGFRTRAAAVGRAAIAATIPATRPQNRRAWPHRARPVRPGSWIGVGCPDRLIPDRVEAGPLRRRCLVASARRSRELAVFRLHPW